MKRTDKTLLFIDKMLGRFLLAAVIGLVFVIISLLCDRFRIEHTSGESFLNYTSFTVQNAREGEDVYFSVCRDHVENYTFKGDVDVYVITDSNKPVKVYARDIQGQISNDCDNKVIKAKDYHHTPNIYEMSFCVDFHVKYDIKKTVCKTSNRYRIYAQPQDVKSQLDAAEKLVETLKEQLADAEAADDRSGQSQSLSVPSVQSTMPSSKGNASPGAGGSSSTGSSSGGSSSGSTGGSNQTLPPPPPSATSQPGIIEALVNNVLSAPKSIVNGISNILKGDDK
jgi:uncharacterized membrane protein YgcG